MNFKGEISEIIKGAEIICADIVCGETVYVSQNDEGLKVYEKDGEYGISYGTKVEFFRGLMILLDKINKNEKNFRIKQCKKFNTCGAMIDVSRRSVLKVETVKNMIVYMAKMGLDTLMLYTEDMFKMEKYPYFGYMRGAYTKEEIKEIVRFGKIFGVELVPCIQTLAHLQTTLKWKYAQGMCDTNDVLLIGEEKTYEFIEEMIKTTRECYETDKIHIGMDEAMGVGLGKYLQLNGYEDRYEILSKHLKKVIEITNKYNFKPMMWADMFFRFCSKIGAYPVPDVVIPDNITEFIPEEISLVYWDYYTFEEETYDAMIKLHKKMERDVVFAGGIWTWSAFSPNYDRAFAITKPALNACKNNGIKDVLATMWGDDGAECNVYMSLYGLQLYAEYNYEDEVDDVHLAKMFKICTGLNAKDFEVFNTEAFDGEYFDHRTFVAKQIFYSDLLLGILDKNLALYDFKTHYKRLLDKFEDIKPEAEFKYLFDFQKAFIEVVYKKCGVGDRLTKAYKSNDREEMKNIAEEIEDIYIATQKMHELYTFAWYKDKKPFGYEVVDARIGGVETRTLRAKNRIEDYLEGRISSIPELEEERLWYNEIQSPFLDLEHSQKMMTV